MHRRIPAFVLVGVWLGVWLASAATANADAQQQGVVQRSSLRWITKQRTQAIAKAREERVTPQATARMVKQALRMDVNSREFRKAVAKIPLSGRFKIFKHKVEGQAGRQEAFTALEAAQNVVKTRQAALDEVSADQATVSDARKLGFAQGTLCRAKRTLTAAETAYSAFNVQSFKRKVSGTLYLGKKRNNNTPLLEVVEAGGMAGRGRELIEAGQVSVNGEVVRHVTMVGTAGKEPIRVAAADKVTVQVRKEDRMWRGMMKQGTSLSREKTFFEVSPETFDLFTKVMGPNVAWFAGNRDPGHLHSLIADQGGRGEMHHNTHGTTFDRGAVRGNYTQVVMPIVLTDREMDRYVRYQNAGQQAGFTHRKRVYGFYARGKKIDDIACT
ncbi:MAG: hypothetical protein JRH20_28310, partial [Deltaproteobacteria bacterium]|nr:hypothetical protein [Deltaproteobacteria bacterium]